MEPIIGTVESFGSNYISVVFRGTEVTFKSSRGYLGNVGDTIELISKPVEHSTYPFDILPFDQLFLKNEHEYSVEYWCYGPDGLQDGQLWYNTKDGYRYVYCDKQWNRVVRK